VVPSPAASPTALIPSRIRHALATLRTSRLFRPFIGPATTAISTLSLHDALPIFGGGRRVACAGQLHGKPGRPSAGRHRRWPADRSEEHTSELQSRRDLVCRLLLEKKRIWAVATDEGQLEAERRGEGGWIVASSYN